MTVDKALKEVQVSLLNLANTIQRVREMRLRQSPTHRERKDKVLLETTQKLNEVWKELGL